MALLNAVIDPDVKSFNNVFFAFNALRLALILLY